MKWLQRALGIEHIYDQLIGLNNYITGLRGEMAALKSLKSEIQIHNRSLARVIAKLDPMFGEDEISPERKAASDKLTEQVMRKLIGEHLASNQHLGDNAV